MYFNLIYSNVFMYINVYKNSKQGEKHRRNQAFEKKFSDISFNTAKAECQNNAFVRVMEIIKTQSESYLDNE